MRAKGLIMWSISQPYACFTQAIKRKVSRGNEAHIRKEKKKKCSIITCYLNRDKHARHHHSHCHLVIIILDIASKLYITEISLCYVDHP